MLEIANLEVVYNEVILVLRGLSIEVPDGQIVALSAALITGLTFHNVSVMAEGGLTDTEAAAIFVPQMVGVVSASFVVGWLTDRVRAQVLVPFAGLSLAAAVAMATAVSPGVAAILYGLLSGIAGGSIRATAGGPLVVARRSSSANASWRMRTSWTASSSESRSCWASRIRSIA